MALKNFPDVPLSRGSSPKTKIRVIEKKLGDGYTQVAADGLNAQPISFSAKFTTRPTGEIKKVHDFLTMHAGVVPFIFTLPGEAAARQWRCKSWTGPTWVSSTHRSLSATFIEDFSIA